MGTPTDFAAKGCTGMRRPFNRAPAKIVLVALTSINSVSTLRRAPANAEHPSSSTCYYYGAISDLRSALALICYNFIVVQFASNISIAMPHPDDPPVPPPPPLPVVPELSTTLDSPGLLDPLKRKFGESRRMGDENKVSLLSISFIPCHPTNKLTHLVDSALAQEPLFRRRPLTNHQLPFPFLGRPTPRPMRDRRLSNAQGRAPKSH